MGVSSPDTKAIIANIRRPVKGFPLSTHADRKRSEKLFPQQPHYGTTIFLSKNEAPKTFTV